MEKTKQDARLDAVIDKYDKLFGKLMAIADYMEREYDCPYFCEINTYHSKKAAVMGKLYCPIDCEGELSKENECWRKWVLESPEEWWTE